jgi:hypothetical protein
MTAASRSHTSRPGAACARGIDKSSGAARRACSGRYPLRRRSSMARATAFAVMPTPSSSFGRARSHGRPPPSMTSVQGSAPGQGLGIRLCASTRGSIEVFILYEYASTVVRPCQPQSQENASRASVATARGQSGRPATCSSPAQALVSVSGGTERGVRPGQARLRGRVGYRSLSRTPGSPGVRHHEENPSVRRGLSREATRRVPSERPARGHTEPVRTGRSRFHPPVNAGEGLPRLQSPGHARCAGCPPWSSIAARSATASPSSRRSWPPSATSRRHDGRGVRRRCASRWSGTPTRANRR